MFHSKFLDAKAALSEASRKCKGELRSDGGALPCYHAMSMAMAAGQNFYLPLSGFVLEGKEFSSEYTKFMRLPFPSINLLTDLFYKGPTGEPTREGYKISTAFDHQAFFETFDLESRKILMSGWTEEEKVNFGKPGFSVWTSIRYDENKIWNPIPIGVTMRPGPEGKGILIGAIRYNEWTNEKIRTVEKGRKDAGYLDTMFENELKDDVDAIMNLCVLLGLRNVSTEKVSASPNLNKSRALRKKAALPDFHVLKVNDEIWDGQQNYSCGSGEGVRSHLRRGHIRHFNDGSTCWVRNTVVHGRREGFVEKDYEL